MRSSQTHVAALIGILAGSSCVSDPAAPDAGDIAWIEILPYSVSSDTSIVPVVLTPVAYDGVGRVMPVDDYSWLSSAPEVVTVAEPDGVGVVRDRGAATVSASVDRVTGGAIVLSDTHGTADSTAVEVLSLPEAISGAVLGLGPLAAEGAYHSCAYAGRWTTFPRGATVAVRVSTEVPLEAREAIRVAVGQVATATRGALGATFGLVDDADIAPRRHEVVVDVHPSPVSVGCPVQSGCTLHDFERLGVFRSGRVVLPPYQTPAGFVHDAVGHAVLGMCHVEASRIGRPQRSLMSNGPGVRTNDLSVVLSDFDVEVQRAVWASGLEPGADTDAFRRAGLIRPASMR